MTRETYSGGTPFANTHTKHLQNGQKIQTEGFLQNCKEILYLIACSKIQVQTKKIKLCLAYLDMGISLPLMRMFYLNLLS